MLESAIFKSEILKTMQIQWDCEKCMEWIIANLVHEWKMFQSRIVLTEDQSMEWKTLMGSSNLKIHPKEPKYIQTQAEQEILNHWVYFKEIIKRYLLSWMKSFASLSEKKERLS